ncbi:hypothetical protein EB118_10730 [bacterium]|nr:hypothetical protein [bacterium]NDG30530.1 hypothetical protein [bacterium]
MVLTIKGTDGTEKVTIKVDNDVIQPSFTLSKTPVTLYYTVSNLKQNLTIDFTNDDGPRDVIVSKLDYNNRSVLNTVTHNIPYAQEYARQGMFKWGGKYSVVLNAPSPATSIRTPAPSPATSIRTPAPSPATSIIAPAPSPATSKKALVATSINTLALTGP